MTLGLCSTVQRQSSSTFALPYPTPLHRSSLSLPSTNRSYWSLHLHTGGRLPLSVVVFLHLRSPPSISHKHLLHYFSHYFSTPFSLQGLSKNPLKIQETVHKLLIPNCWVIHFLLKIRSYLAFSRLKT